MDEFFKVEDEFEEFGFLKMIIKSDCTNIPTFFWHFAMHLNIQVVFFLKIVVHLNI